MKDEDIVPKDFLEEALATISKNLEDTGEVGDISLTRKDVAVLYALATRLYDEGNYSDAEAIFRRLATAKPLVFQHWRGLGAVLQCSEKYEEALIAWSMSCLLNNEDPLPHFYAAECLLSLEQTDEALKALSAAKERVTSSTEDIELMGKIEAMQQAWQTVKEES